jgi:hypothetical protein
MDEQDPDERMVKRKEEEPACIVCGETAEFCMRGLPKNTYCRDCAEDYFQLLEYLDKL